MKKRTVLMIGTIASVSMLTACGITNQSAPCIYVKKADKVFVTTMGSKNSLSVTGSFQADGDTKVDAVIFAKEDLVLNGTGTLTISSTDNAVASKDGIKVTGGSLQVSCKGNALEAHDAIEIADGQIEVSACNDGLHADDNDDETKGAIYIGGTIIENGQETNAITNQMMGGKGKKRMKGNRTR